MALSKSRCRPPSLTGYRLSPGYFQAKLPHPSRATTGHQPAGISRAEMRRLAWHLPDDFATRSTAEQEEILEWVRRVVISGSTDYRRYQADAMKLRYAVRFPALQSAKPQKRAVDEDEDRARQDEVDPELAPPPRLASEMAALISFKTATLTALGYQRRGVCRHGAIGRRRASLGDGGETLRLHQVQKLE